MQPGSPAQALPTIPVDGLLAHASTVLLLVGAAVLIYRSFRGPYLLSWVLGWLAYLLHKFTAADAAGHAGIGAVSAGMYVLAIGLFATSVFYYTDERRWMKPVIAVSALTLVVAVVHAYRLPARDHLDYVIVGLFALIRAAAAVRLALFTRGRKNVGPILLIVALLLLHMHDPGTSDVFAGFDFVLELLLALGMFVIVLEDSFQRSRRLQVLSGLATAIAEARDYLHIVHTALEQLKQVTGAAGAWFRLLEGDELVLVDHIGVSERFANDRRKISLSTSLTGRIVTANAPIVVRPADADEITRTRFHAEGYAHGIIVPILGKKTVIGSLGLGIRDHRSYRSDELEFFGTIANELGIAIENQRLFDQILQSQKQWASTFDSIQDSVLVHDENFEIVRVNEALARRVDRHAIGSIGLKCSELLPGVGRTWQEWQGCPYCWRPSEYDALADPCFGGYSRVSTSSYNEQGSKRVGTVHIVKDVTEHRAVEERYRLLFEQVQEGVFISTPEGRLLDCNDAFVGMLGYSSKEEVLEIDIPTMLYSDPSIRADLLRQIDQRGYLRSFEITLRRKDGSSIPVLETSFARRDADGRVVTYQGFLLDMTEKKRAEDEIRRRNRELSALNSIAVAATQSFDLDAILTVTLDQAVELFSADTGAVLLFDEHTKTLRRTVWKGLRSAYANKVSEFHVPDELIEAVRRSEIDLITEEHLPRLPAFVSELVRAEGLESWMWVVLWAGDKPVGVLAISSRVPNSFTASNRDLLVAIGRQLATTIQKVDLYNQTRRAYEELTHTQEQLLQSEKMSAIGQLISGVAHELNNPLTAILGYAQLLEGEEIPARAQDFVQKLYKQAQRTHKIVQNLLSFSRQRKPQRLPVDLARVVEDTLALRDYDMKLSNITVEREAAEGLPSVLADEHQLEQVFLNIINNAVDAILEQSRSGMLRVRIFLDQTDVCVEFRDSGPGIADTKRIFDPFYTTKSVGKGTGLGLSICYGIVREHGGSIVARNHPEGGAVFQVRLPASVAYAEKVGALPALQRDVPLQGRVLLLDDEESVLEFEREVLRGAGAEVVTFTSGEEAIARIRSESFDAIVVDGKMPGAWTGMDIYHWAALNRAGAEKNVVLAVSNVNDPEIRAFIEQTGITYLTKPFDVADLVETVRRVMKKTKAAKAGV